MAEVMEVKVGQSCAQAGGLKGMPDILPAIPYGIVKHPRHVRPGSEPAEHAPERFIEGQRTRLAVLRLLQAYKPVGHVHEIPGETEQFPFSHPGMKGREHNGTE